jgi:hypothetical protein
MAYHTMIPSEELWNLASPVYRGTKTDFDGRYKYFIKIRSTSSRLCCCGEERKNEDYRRRRSGLVR